MMPFNTLLLDIQDGIATITVNRPKALNALNPEVVGELGQAVKEIAENKDVRVLILTGSGDKAFVAGADIAAMSQMTPLQAKRFSWAGHEVMFALEALEIPVIAAVNGFALGGGTEIAMSCDFIYASEKAKFGQPEINLGIIPGFGGTQRLPRLVGKGWAKEIVLTGEMISAQQAKELGLVNKVFPPDALMDEVFKTAKLLASKGRASLRAAKQAMNRGFDVDLRNACAMEVDAFAVCFTSPDAKEGLTAFLEKRKPELKGEI
ncbi:MAG TPA: enoyl-CoA hydratase-related protein [Thermodesulfobacteriota bacterium]|nr:enoyl-CoA hydratase-related protein [Thermodesulfobacteriota bacterium]